MTRLPDNNPATRDAILAERAQQLARQAADASRSEAVLTVVVFRMAHETYALEMRRIRGIHPLADITKIPGVPDFIRGIINLRGEIISVVDLKIFFDLTDDAPVRSPQVIILSSDDMEFGILADDILGIRDIPETRIQKSLPTLSGVRADYLKGITAGGTVIIDDAKLLSDKKMCITL